MVELLLDSDIRDYATLPIVFVFLCANIIRSNLMTITKTEPKVDMKQMKLNNMLARARMMRGPSSRFLTDGAFRNRKAFYAHPEKGLLMHPPPKEDPMAAMQAQDPTQQMGMMKTQMIFLVSQGILGYWVNYLYTGFLVAKTPFPLTFRFKQQLQRGVDVDNLEGGYISGLCWYFINMMTISGIQMWVTSLFQGEEQQIDPNGQEDMMMMMGMPNQAAMNPLMGGQDHAKMYQQERDGLEIFYHDSIFDSDELTKGLLKKLKKGTMVNA